MKPNLVSFEMSEELEIIKKKTKFSFKALVKKQAKALALLTVLEKKAPHTKMNDLEYLEL